MDTVRNYWVTKGGMNQEILETSVLAFDHSGEEGVPNRRSCMCNGPALRESLTHLKASVFVLYKRTVLVVSVD